jgi:uncharacterized protein (DUF488 family)
VGKQTIYTVGTSNHTQAYFLHLLTHYAVQTVVDVRRSPYSKFEHFRKEYFVRILQEGGIRYVFMGKELGGFREGGYGAYTQSTTYRKSIFRLEQIAQEETTALVCAERLPWKCHRRFIAATLEKRGWEVVHIIDKDKAWSPYAARSEKSDGDLLPLS